MKRFVIADIHGRYKALKECFERSEFNYDEDFLIVDGDVCDRGTEVKECYDELLKIKNLIFIRGNHDDMFYKWVKGINLDTELWCRNGGLETMKSYDNHRNYVPNTHTELIEKGKYYYLTEDNKLFVHAGINVGRDLWEQDIYDLTWNRDFIKYSFLYKNKIPKYDEIYIGHTPTFRYNSDSICEFGNVWCLDTGAGHGHILSIMNIDSKEVFESDYIKK